jgi:hypothetical protein
MQARKIKALDFNRGFQQEALPTRRPTLVREETGSLIQEVESVPAELGRQQEVAPEPGFDPPSQEHEVPMPYTTEPEEMASESVCNGLCVQRAEEGMPLAYVVSLSACEDDQEAWEDGAGSSMTQVCF